MVVWRENDPVMKKATKGWLCGGPMTQPWIRRLVTERQLTETKQIIER